MGDCSTWRSRNPRYCFGNHRSPNLHPQPRHPNKLPRIPAHHHPIPCQSHRRNHQIIPPNRSPRSLQNRPNHPIPRRRPIVKRSRIKRCQQPREPAKIRLNPLTLPGPELQFPPNHTATMNLRHPKTLKPFLKPSLPPRQPDPDIRIQQVLGHCRPSRSSKASGNGSIGSASSSVKNPQALTK